MECGGKTGLSLELITRRWYQTVIHHFLAANAGTAVHLPG
jgi:hypothetical protein